MHNPQSVQEYETHKLLWDFEIQTDYQTTRTRDSQNQQERARRLVHIATVTYP